MIQLVLRLDKRGFRAEGKADNPRTSKRWSLKMKSIKRKRKYEGNHSRRIWGGLYAD